MNWSQILTNLINKMGKTKTQDLFGRVGSNAKYMDKARESLGSVSNVISKDTLQKIARTIKDSEKAKKLYSPSNNEVNNLADKVVRGKSTTVYSPMSTRYVTDGKGSSPYTQGTYSIDRTNDDERKVRIESTAVEGINYDPKTRILSVKFRTGDKWYNYANVSKELYQSFLDAASKGRFVWSDLYKKHWLPGYTGRKGRR